MKKFFTAVLMFSLAVPSFSQSVTQLGNHRSRVVYAPATAAFTNAGFDVAAGDTIEIQARGMANGVADLTQWGWAGPAGRDIADNQYPLPNKPINSLIGRIGTAWQLFYVGETIVLVVNTAGRLYLGINDFLVGDNLGSFVAWVYKRIGTFSAVDGATGLPAMTKLEQNYPNPFNPSTTINFEMPQRGDVQVRIYNSLGQSVRSLVNEQREPGTHSVVWDGKDNGGSVVASGSYFYQVQIGDLVQAKKMILLK